MSLNVTRPPFDQNDKKYKCCCGALHIRQGARIVAILTFAATAANIIFSFTRSSTVAMYTLMSATFAVVVFGSLLFGVMKEKRLYLVPYMIFQVISIGTTMLVLLAFIISLAVHSDMVIQLAQDVGNININVPQDSLDAALASFTVLFVLALCIGAFVQAFFLEVIYAFYQFLRDREMSFNFNFDTSAFNNNPYVPEACIPTA